jgi:hypothetical protein
MLPEVASPVAYIAISSEGGVKYQVGIFEIAVETDLSACCSLFFCSATAASGVPGLGADAHPARTKTAVNTDK